MMASIASSVVVLMAAAAAGLAAAAQTPPEDIVQIVATRDGCPTEPHPKAINPVVLECHARFAPLPVIPTEIEVGSAQQLEKLNADADVLLHQLDRPEACGAGAKVHPNEACAILVYILDQNHRQAGLPWTYIVKIYRINHPADGDIREMTLTTASSNNALFNFGPGGRDGEIWNLLAEQRVTTRCKPGMREFLLGTSSGFGSASAGFHKFLRPDNQCRDRSDDARYRPVLLIGRGEAERVLNPASVKFNFGAQ